MGGMGYLVLDYLLVVLYSNNRNIGQESCDPATNCI